MAAAGGAAIFAASHRASAQEPADRAAVDESLRGHLLFWSSPTWDPENFGVFAYDFETRNWPRVFDGVEPEWSCRVSPNGKSFALTEGVRPHPRVSIIRPDGRTKVSELPCRVFWAPDGREVVLSEWESGRRRPISKTWRMNADGTGRVQLPVPDDELVLDWSPNGRCFLVVRKSDDGRKKTLLIRRADGTEPRPLIDEENAVNAWPGRFSPDGRHVAYNRVDQQINESSLWVIEVATRLDRRILEGDADGYPDDSPCWSPDGKYLAVLMLDRGKEVTNRDARIEIVDLQGHRIRRLGIPHKYPVPCDWR
jgi:Tol biopolymer transport system component